MLLMFYQSVELIIRPVYNKRTIVSTLIRNFFQGKTISEIYITDTIVVGPVINRVYPWYITSIPVISLRHKDDNFILYD